MMIARAFKAAVGLAGTRTGKRSSLVLVANAGAAVMGMLGFVLISRILGPEALGLVALGVATAATIVGITDLGVGTAFSTIVSPLRHDRPGDARAFLRATLKVEVALGAAILLSALVLPDLLAPQLGNRAETDTVLALGIITGAVMSTGAYVGVTLQAFERFRPMVLYILLNAVLRLGLVVLLAATGNLTIVSALITNTLAAGVSLLVGLLMVPRIRTSQPGISEREALRKLVKFGKWAMVTTLIGAIAMRLDIFFLAHYRPAEEVGIYSAAYQLTLPLTLLLSSVSVVLLPKLAQVPNKQELVRVLRKVVLGSGAVAVLLLLAIPVAPWVVNLVLGDAFDRSGLILQILIGGFLVNLFVSPLALAFFAMGQPKRYALLICAFMVPQALLFFWLVPAYGAIGTALAVAIGGTLTGLGSVVALGLSLRNLPEQKPWASK